MTFKPAAGRPGNSRNIRAPLVPLDFERDISSEFREQFLVLEEIVGVEMPDKIRSENQVIGTDVAFRPLDRQRSAPGEGHSCPKIGNRTCSTNVGRVPSALYIPHRWILVNRSTLFNGG